MKVERMPQELMQVMYTSTHGGVSEEELQSLSEEVFDLNARYDIGGLLVIGEEYFLVILEGDPIVVTTFLIKNAKDPRHHSLNILLAGSTKGRVFQGWKVRELKEGEPDKIFSEIGIKISELNHKEIEKPRLERIILDLSKAV